MSIRLGRATAIGITAALAIAACGGGDDAGTADTGGTDTAAEATAPGTGADGTAPSSDGTTPTVPEGEFDQSATFIYAYPIGVSRLDPHKASISQDGTTLFPVYDRLVHLAPDGAFIPGLAESWEFSDDGTTLTLKIREGVTFHDGAEFDAEVAKTNLDRARTLEGSSVQTDLASVEEITVVDPTTIELALSEPNVSIIGSLADRAGIQISPKALADGVDLDQNMVGAGPYKMVEHEPGNTTIYERNEDYWDTENIPNVAKLEIRVIGDQVARLNALRGGQIHATQLGQNQVEEAENEGLNVTLNTELQYFYVVQNRSLGQQDDLRVRQALLHSLDREAICEALLYGYCELTDQPFPPGYFAYNDEIDDVLYPYDPDKARALLDEAGVENLELQMLIPVGLPTYPEMSETMQAAWGEFGIDVTIKPAEPTQLGELMFAQASSEMMLASWGGRPDPGMTLNQRTSAEGFANPGGHTTEKMTELRELANSAADPAEREAALQAASREVAESILEMVVLFPQIPYGMTDGVVFEPYLTAKPEFRNIGILK